MKDTTFSAVLRNIEGNQNQARHFAESAVAKACRQVRRQQEQKLHNINYVRAYIALATDEEIPGIIAQLPAEMLAQIRK